ncbi:MAG: sensory histidine kinase AtoS [Alphaproteobacteria bacterium ADurb.BinA305]|nr:MAG: sensory histidine kinase AtoS [Alphaproteobacteria bacterium ADurb.BinA305]
MRDRIAVMAQAGTEESSNHIAKQVRLREAAFDSSAEAQVVLDLARSLSLANERARALFGLSLRDIGTPANELELFARMGDLRTAAEHAFSDRRPVILREIQWHTSADEVRYFDLQAVPLIDHSGALIGVSAGFQDVTEHKRLQNDLEQSRHELETAYEELQSTNEELETTNEELQSTTEELETTNEELQSTNEELETMNEELQSTNEEMETMNEELRQRSVELAEVNGYLNSILASIRAAVVVVDREQRVRIWNQRSEDMWGLRSEEAVGQHLLNLDIGLPTDRLRVPLRGALADSGSFAEITLPATNRRGRSVQVRVNCTPLLGPQKQIDGAILMIEEIPADGASAQPAENTAPQPAENAAPQAAPQEGSK